MGRNFGGDSMEERRKYPRFEVNHPVTLSEDKNTNKLRRQSKAETENVSKGGFLLRTEEPIVAEKVLNLRIYEHSSGEPVDVEAKVVWCNKKHGSFVQGMAFTKIGWIEADRILRP